jgi:hypothetical protein
MTARDLSMSRFLLLSLGTALAACSPAIGDYGREYEEAFCAWQHKCHVYEKKSDCIDAETLERDPEFDYLVRAVAAGNVDYDADAAADCLDAIAERSCDYQMTTPEVCDRVFKGRVGKNAPCLSTAECAGNAVCGFNPNCGDDQCCVGACRVFADPVEVGEPCSFSGTDCVPEAFCATDPVTFMPTVCTERVKAGGNCSAGQQCVEGAQCDGTECREIELRGPGERCDEEFVSCEPPGQCNYADGEAVCVVAGELGAPCTGGSGCNRFDTFCDEPSGLCTLLPGPGQPCVNGYECLPYASCDGAYYDEFGEQQGDSSVCVARAKIGEACGPAEGDKRAVDCLGELQCEAGTCVLPPLMVTEQCEPPTDE